ncbi:MAG: hypothetical protein ACM3ML_12585 [Micromonosporaceae bacterium]
MNLVERAGHLKPMLVDFALSPRFDRELSAVIARNFPGGVVTDESVFSMVLDHFALQHRLPSGNTVVEAFIAAHPELTGAERDMLLGWRDVVEGIFDIAGKDRDALVLFNFLDELSYRARSNLGRRAFKPLKKGMIVVGRLVRAGDDWMISGNPAAFPASARDQMLAVAAEQAVRNPEAVFRNPAKLAEARRILAQHHETFVDLFGTDLIVVPGIEVPGKVEEFHRHLAQQARAGAEPPELAPMDLPDDLLAADSVAIHFAAGEGLSFYPGYHLLEELFSDPALVSRRRYRETLSGFLRDPNTSPEPLQRLAARDPAKASTVFARLLNRKRGFSWDTDGEQLLRRHKPSYFDGTLLPRTVPLSEFLSDALRHAR